MKKPGLFLMLILAMTFVSCGTPPGVLVVNIDLPDGKRLFKPQSEESEDFFEADRGKIILENEENRIEVTISPGEREKRLEDIPAGTYSLTIVFYNGDIVTAWGSVPNVKVKKNVETHISVALKIQKEWE